MRKFIGLLGFIILSSSFAYAQTGSIRGNLVDASTKAPIIGAVVEIYATDTPDNKSHYPTESQGSINVRSIPYGSYKLVFSYLGYQNREVPVTVDRQSVDIGTITLRESSMTIDQVTVEVPAMRTSQKGDTVVYNAAAFKVAVDADTEGLLAKMPGITVSGGTVEAQGEEIKKVLVDGREFFGDDVTSAIRNLPAEVVERVEVFNKLSDQAEFTGIDDGEGYKAINIITSQDKRSGQFGKLYGAWGFTDHSADKYIVGGNVNIFQGDSRISLIGLANNLNQQNFSFEDILGVVNTGGSSSGGGRMGRGGGGGVRGFMVRPQDGVATVQSFGVNYSDKWGKKVDFTGSYFFNHTNTVNHFSRQMWNFDGDGDTYSETLGNSDTQNFNHRFNGRIDYKISDRHNIMVRPSFSYQSNDNTGNSEQSIYNLLADESKVKINDIEEGEDGERTGYYAGLSILYRAKIGDKPGRTLTVDMDGNYSKNAYDEYVSYFSQYQTGIRADSVGDNRRLADNYNYRLGGGVTYTEPIGAKSILSLEYKANYTYSDENIERYLWDSGLNMLNPAYDDLLSSIGNSGYLRHTVGPGYRFNTPKANFSVNVNYQYSTLDTELVRPLRSQPEITYDFSNVVYAANANFNFNPANSLRIFIRSNTSNPSMNQLQDVPSFSSSRITAGNPDLAPSYTHSLRAHYVNSNINKGRTFNIGVDMRLNQNYIGQSTVTYSPGRVFVIPGGPDGRVLEPGERYSVYQNFDGNWFARMFASYGMPVKFLQSNLNFNLGASLGETPSILNGISNTTRETYFNGGVTLSSNISEKVDFTVSYNGSYNLSDNINSSGTSRDKFLIQYASASMKFVIWKGITFSGNISYTQNRGITTRTNDEYLLCNIYLGKKIFKNQRGEISIGVNDLFDQNTSFRRTVNTTSITNATNSAIGRYYSVQFIYNLRNFGKKGSKNSRDYEGLDSQGDRPTGVQRSSQPGPGGPHFYGPPPR